LTNVLSRKKGEAENTDDGGDYPDLAKGAGMNTDQILLLLLIITLYGVPTAIAIRRKHGHVVLRIFPMNQTASPSDSCSAL
jgi:hypothetical protein